MGFYKGTDLGLELIWIPGMRHGIWTAHFVWMLRGPSFSSLLRIFFKSRVEVGFCF